MPENEKLRTASLYINNQLLSRGLLRDGLKIDFANPGDENGEVAGTMARIMVALNDLILRRDRDAEHRESLSTTLRSVRAEALRQTNDVQRLQERLAEVQRKALLSEAAEAAAQARLKSVEAQVQKLQGKAARTKLLVAQTRAACANEVRKRDRQLDGLKKAVVEAARARGSAKSSALTTITVTGDVPDSPGGDSGVESRDISGAEGYDLRMETNSFLAELARGLSDENETLMSLLRRTVQQLKKMSGWDGTTAYQVGEQGAALPPNCVELADEINAVLEHLRIILTNPSFVPLEEVVVREEEINRLRQGWERMETRWKEAVNLMDGWRRRMQQNGRPVNVEELNMGLRLSPVRIRNVNETANGMDFGLSTVQEESEERSMHQSLQTPSPADSYQGAQGEDYEDEGEGEDEDDCDSESSLVEDDVDVGELDVDEPNVQILEQSMLEPMESLTSPPLPVPPQLSPLRDSYSAGNRLFGGGTGAEHKYERDFSIMTEEETNGLAAAQIEEFQLNAPIPPPHGKRGRGSRTEKSAATPVSREVTPPPSDTSLDSVLLVGAAEVSVSKASVSSSLRSQRTWNEKSPQDTTTTTTKALGLKTTKQLLQRAIRDKSDTSASSAKKTAARSPQRCTASERPSQKPSEGEKPTPARAPACTVPTPSYCRPTASSRANINTITINAKSSGSFSSAKSNEEPQRTPRRAHSRLPMPRSERGNNLLPPPQQSPLSMATITAKLIASERDADAARVRAKLKAARLGRKAQVQEQFLSPAAAGVQLESATPGIRRAPEEVYFEDALEPVKRSVMSAENVARGGVAGDGDSQQQQPSQKRKRGRRTSKVASRRRSTLNPRELDTLLHGEMQSPMPGREGEVSPGR